MAKLVFDEEFLQQWADVPSQRTTDHIDRILQLISVMPGVGSSLVADSVRVAYGQNVLKMLVGPYQIIYEFDRSKDTVYVYGLLYSPSVA